MCWHVGLVERYGPARAASESVVECGDDAFDGLGVWTEQLELGTVDRQ